MKWEEVEADRNIAVMLKDVRGRIAERELRVERVPDSVIDRDGTRLSNDKRDDVAHQLGPANRL
jgi:hypothetical protein